MIKQGEFEINIYRGDSSELEFQFIDVDDITGLEMPTDLSNIQVSAQIRYTVDSPDVWVSLNPVITNAKDGRISITITSGMSAGTAPVSDPQAPTTGRWDLQFQDLNDPERVFSPLLGPFTVRKDVTRP